MKSPRELFRRLLSSSSSKSPPPASTNTNANAALARSLSSMGKSTGLTLADVMTATPPPTGPSPSSGKRAPGSERAPSAAGDTVAPAADGDEPPPVRLASTMSVSFRPLEENPEWNFFSPFDALEFSFVGGSIGVTRPIPKELEAGAHATLEMVLPVIQKISDIRKLVLARGAVFLVDRPLAEKTEQHASPVDDLRLADVMLRLALVGKPLSYSFWFFQFYQTADVNRILSRMDTGGGRAADGGNQPLAENAVVLHKIESMTGTRILAAPYDPASWRRCFLLLGEEELIARAVTLLSGAITQGMAPTSRENLRQMLAAQPDDPLTTEDARLEEIRQELMAAYHLRMVEVERDGNCLFRAAALSEHKTESRHREVRHVVCTRLKQTPEAVAVVALVEGVTEEEYLERMARNGEWGGYVEVMAYAEAYQRDVRLFVDNGRDIGLRPTTIECGQRGPDKPRLVQLLLYKSHYWLLE